MSSPSLIAPGAAPAPSTSLRSVLLSVLVATVCFAAVIPLANFTLEATIMGKDYEAMSVDPLGGIGPHPERFLTPLLAWLVGLSGQHYWMFSHLMLVVFLALVHHGVWRRSGHHAWAGLFTLGIAMSGTVEVYRALVGYSDPTTYCLLTLCVLCARRRVVFWLLMTLDLLNHGSTLFLWPWLLGVRWHAARLDRFDAGAAVIAIAVYCFARSQLIGPKTLYSVSFFLESLNWRQAVELWALVLPAAVFCFGFLLIVLMWDLTGDQRRAALVEFGLMLVSLGAILFLAIDIIRFIGLLSFPMIAAMHRRLRPDRRSCWTLLAAVLLTLAFLPWQRQLVCHLLTRLGEQQAKMIPFPVLGGLVPQCWPAFAGYVGFLVVLAVAARWTRPITGQPSATVTA